KVASVPPWLDASVAADARSVVVKIHKNPPLGLYGDFVKVAINTPEQPEAWILVKADIHGDVVPAMNPLVTGLIRAGENNEFRIPLTSRSGRAFAVGKVELENVHGTAVIQPCAPAVAGCRWLDLTLSNEQPVGSIKGNIYIELPTQQQKIKIGVRGLLLAKEAKLKTLDPSKPGLGVEEPADLQTHASPQPTVGLDRAIKSAISHVEDSPPPGNGPLLKWTVSNALAIHGFQIFRANNEDGPYVLQNKLTIANKAEDEGSSLYQWRDNTAETGRTYWYYVGVVFNDGRKQTLSSPQRVVAK